VNRSVAPGERRTLRAEATRIVDWSRDAVQLARRLFEQNLRTFREFATFPAHSLQLVRDDGALDLYHGGLRARTRDGATIFDHVDYSTYWEQVFEEVKPWSYMKFPYLRALGPEEGWYRVGPLTRVTGCDFIPSPLAEMQRREFLAFDGGSAAKATLGFHWARMIEMLHAAEVIAALLDDEDISGRELTTRGERRGRGVGVLEAPRGTLIHHYRVNEQDMVIRANLIVSTTHNNEAMNRAVREVARRYLDGRRLTEGLLNHVEVAIRAFDPCLSCATHALGQMPLALELVDADGSRLDRLVRD
jgi:NAD-reducing hydrogenase large subunit